MSKNSNQKEQKQEQEQPKPDMDSILEQLYGDIAKLCAKYNVDESVIIFRFKDINDPFLYWTNENDHYYGAAVLLASVMRDMKNRVIQELDC